MEREEKRRTLKRDREKLTDTMTFPYKIVLPKEKPMSWNDMYAGMHWSERNNEAKRVHALIRYSVSPKNKGPYTGKVGVTIRAYFQKRPYDSDNIASKFYVDGLKGTIILNDTPEYVGPVTTESCVDKNNPRVEIEVFRILPNIA